MPAAAEPLASSIASEEYSREFGEFVESISATPDELAAIVSMPELSIPEVKQQVREGEKGNPRTDRAASGLADLQLLVKIRPAGVRSKHC